MTSPAPNSRYICVLPIVSYHLSQWQPQQNHLPPVFFASIPAMTLEGVPIQNSFKQKGEGANEARPLLTGKMLAGKDGILERNGIEMTQLRL